MEAGLKNGSVIRFADYEIDLKNRELRRNGVRVELQPQAFEILALLASHPARLVTRAQIQSAIWPTEPFSDIHARLNFQIKKIREALGDDPDNPVYIETVPKGGYKLIAPTEAPNNSQSKPEALGNAAKVDRPVWHLRKLAWLVIATLLLAISIVLAAFVTNRRSTSDDAAGKAAIQSARSNNLSPVITSVTPILPQSSQKIVISGHALGNHTAFANLDTPFLAIRDKTADWAAGRMTPENSDEVTLSVPSWTDLEIVITGFSGAYGTQSWKLHPGDEIEVVVWNPQTGNGPATYELRVSTANPAP